MSYYTFLHRYGCKKCNSALIGQKFSLCTEECEHHALAHAILGINCTREPIIAFGFASCNYSHTRALHRTPVRDVIYLLLLLLETVPITKRASFPNKKKKKFCILILIRSTQAAGIVQDTFAGEAGEGEEETTGGFFYHSG